MTCTSKRPTNTVRCPACGGKVEVSERYESVYKDVPLDTRYRQKTVLIYHRYRCLECRKKFTEDLSEIKYSGAKITQRSSHWIKTLLAKGMAIQSVVSITGIHWATVKKVYEDVMDEALLKRDRYRKDTGYKPRYLAVDEFAIHKGHKYATSVMDLENGEIIWVGLGRSMEDFKVFFEETDMDYLSEVEAIAMDMNASYNKVVSERLPNAEIVYDRYHMQAQFGRDVLGAVRLDAAREHKRMAQEYTQMAKDTADEKEKAELKELCKEETLEYRRVKKARWPILMNKDNLTDLQAESLTDILDKHSDLALCYALKEEMTELFCLTDRQEAEQRWTNWFKACMGSGIAPLIRFARNKEKTRLPGLIAHADHHISTGKLEGMNNKIKVAKRIGYGYRDEKYFFKLIRFISIPA